MALVGRHAVPPGGLHTIPLPAATVLVHDTEADLPVGVSLVGGTSVPAHGFGLVPLPAATVLVHAAEVDLRVGVFLVCRHAVPAYCFGVLPLDPTAVRVHDAEVVLRVGVSLFGGTLVPAYCFGVVPLDPTTVRVHGAEVALRVGVFLLGVINANYFGRSTRTRSAGSWVMRAPCETARFLMEDGLVTDVQVRRLREKRMSGKTLAAAAAAAGMSERTARRWQSGALPSTVKAPRRWRTREDPFADVWQSEVVPQAGGRYGGTAAGADAVHGAVPAASGSLCAGAATDVAAARLRLAGAGRSGSGGVLRARLR